MKIEKIAMENIEYLIESICEGKTNKDYRKELGSHINNLFNHISISFYMKEINIIEAMYLKIFSNDHFLSLATIKDSNLINESKFNRMYLDVQSMMKLIEIMQKDDTEFSYEYVELLPAICIQKEGIVTFTGSAIGFLLGAKPDLILQSIYQFKSDEEFQYQYIMDHLDVLENHLIKTLIEQTYKNMLNRELSIDLLVDSLINHKFYEYVSLKNELELSYVSTPFGSLHFLGEDINKDSLEKEISTVKSGYEILPKNQKNKIFSNTKLYFEVSSMYYVFLEMFLALPNRFFCDTLDPKILLYSNSFDFPVTRKFTLRIQKHHERLAEGRNEIANNKDFKIEKYFFTLLNTEMKFTLCLSLEDISLILNSYKDNIISNNIYGNNNEIFIHDILKIIENIENKAKLIYQMIS